MRLAIIIGANPQLYKNTAPTIVKAGTWKVIGQGVVDSEITLQNGSAQYLIGDTFTLEYTSPLCADFKVRGSEKVISLLVEKVK